MLRPISLLSFLFLSTAFVPASYAQNAAQELEQNEKAAMKAAPVKEDPPVEKTPAKQMTVKAKAAPMPEPEAEKEVTADDIKKQSGKAMVELMPVDTANATFSKALVSTYENNPTLNAARFEARSVFERLPQAQAGWKPTITGTVDGTATNQSVDPGSDDSTFSKEAGVALTQPLYRGGRTLNDTLAAQNIIRAQIALVEQTEQIVLLDAVTAYLDVIQNEALLKLSENNQGVLKKQFDATNERFDVGELTRTDVSQAEARYARARSEVTSATGNLRSSRAVFEKIIGYMPENIGFPSVFIEIPQTLDDAVNYAESWNPGVRASKYAQKAAEYDVNSIYGELLPSIALNAGLSKSYDTTENIDTTDNAFIGATATIPIYEAGSVRSRVRQAKQVKTQRIAEISEARRAAREDTISAWENLAAAKAEVESRMAEVEAAEVARFGVQQEADLGARTVLDTLDASQDLLNAQVSLVTAKRNEALAKFQLAAAMGVLNPQTLGFPEKTPDYNKEIKALSQKLFSTDVDSP